jgi:hypothetical protein
MLAVGERFAFEASADPVGLKSGAVTDDFSPRSARFAQADGAGEGNHQPETEASHKAP